MTVAHFHGRCTAPFFEAVGPLLWLQAIPSDKWHDTVADEGIPKRKSSVACNFGYANPSEWS
jgi:hypothetical protein